jgi:hypothetical protein
LAPIKPGLASTADLRSISSFLVSGPTTEISLCLPQIKSGHIGGAVRPESGDRECVQLSRRGVISARLCATANGCACRCNSSCTKAARGADGVRQISRCDQCIPCGSSRSAVLRRRFARASEETSDDLECRSTEPGGQGSRHKLDRGPGSGNEGFAPSHTPPSVDWRSIRPLGARSLQTTGSAADHGP